MKNQDIKKMIQLETWACSRSKRERFSAFQSHMWLIIHQLADSVSIPYLTDTKNRHH